MEAPPFVIGIDLGTTNSAATYVDSRESPWRVRTLAVPQVVAPGQVEAREVLPSFHYQPAEGELPAGALALPWSTEPARHAVGVFARDHGALAPGRQIASAKSWLCHTGVDRTAALLPWHGADDAQRLSPVEASARYLAHLRAAWDHRFPQQPMAEQDVVLTLPASFDEVARELTVKAAQRAGLPRVVLIEEPQAAFYSWIDRHAADWERLVRPGQKILICDIGGGTSDFTLIRVRRGEGGKVRFHRVAVGEHLILGGDNLDLALAHHLEKKLAPGGLPPRQWATLVRTAQRVKEQLLAADAPERLAVALPGAGARLVGGTLQTELARGEVEELLLDGFFPRVELDQRPVPRQSGFQEFGLPYAPDPAITRYLAAFLRAHRQVAMEDVELAEGVDAARPDIVLFNGGVFESPLLARRLLDVLQHWFGGPAAYQPVVLDNERLDLAVARGAAYYGMVRRGAGVRIAAGLARSYYVGVASEPPQAVCLAPAGAEPGQDVTMDRTFGLLVSQPVEFPLYVSSVRLTDPPGALVAVDREQLTPLPPIRTVMKTAKGQAADAAVPIQLHARLSEIGTLDLWCSEVGGRRTWRLVFDVRSTTQTDRTAHAGAAEGEGFIDEEAWTECRRRIEAGFAGRPDGLVKQLTDALGQPRGQWPASLLRRIWEALVELEAARRKSPTHEARWLNLLGFALRPGYGLAMDDYRVAETWRLLQGRLVHPTATCRTEWWILWRRIGGGLAAGQQQALADPLIATVRGLHRQLTGKGRGGDFAFQPHETAEIWRLLGAMELLPAALKVELGGLLTELMDKKKLASARPAIVWAVGRLGTRSPLYGPLNAVVPADAAGEWLRRLMTGSSARPEEHLAAMQLARHTGDRYRDLPERLRVEAAAWLEAAAAAGHLVQLVREGGRLDAEEQGMVFGEALPHGLRLE